MSVGHDASVVEIWTQLNRLPGPLDVVLVSHRGAEGGEHSIAQDVEYGAAEAAPQTRQSRAVEVPHWP